MSPLVMVPVPLKFQRDPKGVMVFAAVNISNFNLTCQIAIVTNQWHRPVSTSQHGPPKSFCRKPCKFRTPDFEARTFHVTTINANRPKLFSFNWGKVDGEAGSSCSIEPFGGRPVRSSGVWMLHCKRCGKELAIVMAHAPSTRGLQISLRAP